MAGLGELRDSFTPFERKDFDRVEEFAHSSGPILSPAEQKLALGAPSGDLKHFPSNEGLLEQLRTEAKKYVDESVPAQVNSLKGWHPDEEVSDITDQIDSSDRAYLRGMERIKNYTASDLKDIGDLANAANNPSQLSKIMQRFHDAKSFASLEDGMSLELIRRGLNADAVMCASDVSGAKPRPCADGYE